MGIRTEACLDYSFDVVFENYPVKDLTTGTIYPSAEAACHANGLSYYRMKRHLDGEVSALRRHKYAYEK